MNDQLLDSEQVPAFLQDLENFLQLRLGIKWDFSWDEDNECLSIAACCFPDGTCEDMNAWQCSKLIGKWQGRCLGCDNSNSNTAGDWCCPTCSDLGGEE